MPADYEQIRAENIARYGWDTAVLDLLGHLYSERTHFIFELIQNAEDAGATKIAFDVHDDRLEVRHDGRPFTAADVRGICGVAKSTKDLTSIGKFGIGFKAVYAYTRTPRIYSGDEAFGIENYVRPYPVEPAGAELLRAGETLFVFPLDSVADAAEIRAALGALDPSALLFLRNIKQLTGLIAGDDRWRVFRRPAGAHQVQIAFLADPAIVACASSPLYVYLPTQKETFLGFLVQGPYRTTPARDNIGEHDPHNQALVRETGTLLTDALRTLRDEGLLTVDALAALPVNPARFAPGSFFRPLFNAARDALASEQLIPVAGGGYRSAGQVRLAADPALHDLFGGGNPFWFVPGTSTPELQDYLRDEIGIAEVSDADLAAQVSAEFLTAQSDQWLIGFYRYIMADLDSWRSRPVIRLEDGRQVLPEGAYLPGPEPSGFPTVRRSIAANPSARALLDAFGLATADVVDEVLRLVMPKYGGELPADHDGDLALIMRALDEAPPARRQLLDEALRRTAFLIGENAASGEQRLTVPGELYQRDRALETYFDGNPGAWFAADRYGPWRRQLREMGVRETVAVRARTPDLFGYVPLVDEFARHERGLDGFDPDADIDGLLFALSHAGHARSEYVWNSVLAPNHRLIAGVVEKSVRDAFVDATRETTGSAISEAASRQAWLPAPDGSFRRPAELSLADLPPAFTRDENLARALGLGEPVVARAAEQLGLPAELLWTLSARPDLVATLMEQLRS